MFTAAEVEQLKFALIELLKSEDLSVKASAAFALGKTHDPSIREILDQELENALHHLLRHNTILNNCLFALDDVGDKIFEKSSAGISDVEENIRLARKRFEPKGKKYPW